MCSGNGWCGRWSPCHCCCVATLSGSLGRGRVQVFDFEQVSVQAPVGLERAIPDDVGGVGVVGGVDVHGQWLLGKGVRLGGLPGWLAWAVADVAVAVFWCTAAAVFGVPEVPWFVGVDGLLAAGSAADHGAGGDDGCPVGA